MIVKKCCGVSGGMVSEQGSCCGDPPASSVQRAARDTRASAASCRCGSDPSVLRSRQRFASELTA